MISPIFLLVYLLLTVTTVCSSAVPPPLSLASGSLNQPGAYDAVTNSTTIQNLASAAPPYSPECDNLHGRHLARASCDNALAKITQVTTPMTFGERETGTWDVVLPRRYLSGTSSILSLRFKFRSLLEKCTCTA